MTPGPLAVCPSLIPFLRDENEAAVCANTSPSRDCIGSAFKERPLKAKSC